jgi:hypothetical protein
MKKIYIAPDMADNSVYLINGIADINLGSGRGGDGDIDNPPSGGYEGGAKERYDDGVVYGNIW